MSDRFRNLNVRAIAYTYILLGALGIVEVVLELVVLRSVYFDVWAVVALFTGRGLLRFREGWRQWAIFVASLEMLAVIVVIFAGAIAIFGFFVPNELSKSLTWDGSPIRGMLLIVLFFAWSAWQFAVFGGSRGVALFAEGRIRLAAEPATRKWQFSLATSLLLTALVAFLMARVLSDDVRYETLWSGGTSTASDAGIVGLSYGVKVDRFTGKEVDLPFVVFSKAKGTWNQNLHQRPSWSRFRKEVVYLKTPDGEAIDLPAERQICEVIDDQVFWRDLRVTIEEFQKFRSLPHAEQTFESLAEFVQQLRAKKEPTE